MVDLCTYDGILSTTKYDFISIVVLLCPMLHNAEMEAWNWNAGNN